GPIIVVATLSVATVIILEASLSFLGLGVQPPTVTWGRMLADGRNYVATAWWLATFPGLFITGLCLSLILVGDWLRDAFDPRLRGEGLSRFAARPRSLIGPAGRPSVRARYG